MTAVPDMDPRVAALMAKLEQAEEREKKKEEEPVFKPPRNLDDFMKVEKMDEWPQHLTSEGPLDIQSEGLLLGSKEDISNLLRDSAPLGLNMLDEMAQKLDALEEKLNFYASQVVTEDNRPSRLQDRLFYSPSRTFMTEVSESDAVKSHHSSKGHRSLDFVDSVMETRKKSLEYCVFPGFRHGELIELPGQLESPPILHRVTKAQDFNPGFKKFWKKIFLSEASVAVMQDAFWWYFVEKFDKKNKVDKDLLYDRIADSYVALFNSINPDFKDKFLLAYPSCLAQAVFAAYWEAFPESRHRFDDTFRQDLVNLISEWTTGTKPVPGTWKNWKVKRLQFKPPKRLEKEPSETAEQMMHAAALNKELKNYSLDIESFEKMVDRLGTDHVTYGASPLGMGREPSKMTNTPSIAPTTISQSRLATAGTATRKSKESHQIGPGPEYERVMFNTSGRSPLISHYLQLRQLRDFHQPGKKVRRTEIVKLPEPGPTYRQLINNTLSMSEALSKEYQKICEQTDQEIMEMERKQRDINREFNNLTRELMFTKNPVDLKILSDKILGLREKESETPLLEDDRDKDIDFDEDYDEE